MARPVTLFTGQWADLTLEDVARKASAWGFDGLELACWGDHFEVDKALADERYVKGRWDILNKYNLKCFAISTHLVGQCVADDPIDARHQRILSGRLWGDGDPEGVRRRCAEEMKNTASAAKKFGVKVVNGLKFGLEVLPTEIAYDIITAHRALEAVGGHSAFGFNFDPSHFIHQFIDPIEFINEFGDRIWHMHVKDSRVQLTGRNSILSSHLDFGDNRPR